MTDYDDSGWERAPFVGSESMPRLITRRRRSAMPGHGATCSPDPEIGCECGQDERQSLDAEARSLGFPSHAALVAVMGPERMAALARRHGPDICPNPRRCENCAGRT